MLSKPRYQKIWKTALLPIIDFLSINVGILVTYVIRYKWLDENFFGTKQVTFLEYLSYSLLLSLAIIIVYAFLGLYQIYGKKNPISDFLKIIFGLGLVLLSIITYFFFNEYNFQALPQGVRISRFILATGGFVALSFLVLGRLVFWIFEQILYKMGISQTEVVVIGDLEAKLTTILSKNSGLKKIHSYKTLDKNNFEEIKDKVVSSQIGEIYLLKDPQKLGKKLAELAERWKVNFIFSPEGFADYQSFGLSVIHIQKKLLLELKHSSLDGWQVVLKRLFDFTFSLVFIICFSWLYLLIALAIKLDSKGSLFYLSERVGPNGKTFKLWKFRRLKQEYCTSESNPESIAFEEALIAERDSRKDGVLYKINDDPRSTRVGKFIEKYSLDELPQFFNVFMGDMSLVGPRPHQPREVAKYANHHYKVFNINPGITGFSQINGRSNISFEDEVGYDTYYIENWNFWMDLWIILRTPIVILFKRHNG